MENQKVELIKRSNSYKLIIPEKVENIIRYLCSKIHDTEWSGILFYKPTGTFENDDLTITCEDILLMDIGSHTYTEFDMNPDVISYMAEHQELLDCQCALIHSHCTFSTFFSSTDQQTLLEEGKDRNHFVSLIVNNAGSYTAAITRRITYTERRDITYPSYDDKEITTTEEYIPKTDVEWFPLDIEFETSSMKEIESRFNKIKEDKKSSKTTSTPSIFTDLTKDYTKDLNNSNTEYTLFPKDTFNFKDYRDDMKFDESAKSSKPDNSKKVSISEDIIISLRNQLLTGSVLATKDSKIDLNKWLDNMEKAFDRRFGANDPRLVVFDFWAESFTEFITWYAIEENGVDEEEASITVAEALIKELESLPKSNKYIEEYINILSNYVITSK